MNTDNRVQIADRVFHNRYILRNILKQVKNVKPPHYYNYLYSLKQRDRIKLKERYHQYTDASSIIKSGYIHLLIDKLKRGEDIPLLNDSPFQLCFHCKDYDSFLYIYKQQQTFFTGNDLVRGACKGGNQRIVELLMNQTYPVNLSRNGCYEMAIKYNNLEVIKYLVSCNIDPVQTSIDSNGRYGYVWAKEACTMESPEIFNYLYFECESEMIRNQMDYFIKEYFIYGVDHIYKIEDGTGKILKLFVETPDHDLLKHYISNTWCMQNHSFAIKKGIIDTLTDPDIIKDSLESTKCLVEETDSLIGRQLNSLEMDMLYVYTVLSNLYFKPTHLANIWVDMIKSEGTSLIPYIIDQSTGPLPFKTICEHGNLEQIQAAVEYIGDNHSLYTPRGFQHIIQRINKSGYTQDDKLYKISSFLLEKLPKSITTYDNEFMDNVSVKNLDVIKYIYQIDGHFGRMVDVNINMTDEIYQFMVKHTDKFTPSIMYQRSLLYRDKIELFQIIRDTNPNPEGDQSYMDKLNESLRYGSPQIARAIIKILEPLIGDKSSGRPLQWYIERYTWKYMIENNYLDCLEIALGLNIEEEAKGLYVHRAISKPNVKALELLEIKLHGQFPTDIISNYAGYVFDNFKKESFEYVVNKYPSLLPKIIEKVFTASKRFDILLWLLEKYPDLSDSIHQSAKQFCENDSSKSIFTRLYNQHFSSQ